MKRRPKKPRRSRAQPGALPKGAYRLPDGGLMHPRTTVYGTQGKRRIVVIGIRRDEPDLAQLAKAFVQLAIEQVQQEQPEHPDKG